MMSNNYLPYNKSIRSFSSDLRKNATKEENHLWYDFLRSYPIRFNRQKIIGSYIVDFYCSKAKLVIELDGSQHYQQDVEEYDIKRSEYLKSLGIIVIRFSNLDVNKNFTGVCARIDEIVKRRKT